jgi:xylan 1,4-beta-xylosidase
MRKYFLILILVVSQAHSQQLVLPGDHPDPSVIKIGDTYWASATTSNWFPAFPLMSSQDLINWKQQGYVFTQKPLWADYYFWAPEISYDNGRVYIYYAAHKKDGNLCIGVASADKPEGPYKDHGPLMCQPDGSIDAFPMRDSDGKLYLIWKEDGNSVGQPTPIWAMQMNEERTALIGEKKELFHNTADWEGNLVEGVSMIRHGDYFYALYAGAGCCGTGCTYATGVARSKNLLGPWEKSPKNPLITSSPAWICPGHGTPIEKDGKYFFLYHGYDRKTNVFTGRQGLLEEFRFTNDGWIEFVPSKLVSQQNFSPVNDSFDHGLSDQWQWSITQPPTFKIKKGSLRLSLPADHFSFLGQKIQSGDYSATTVVSAKSKSPAGIAAIGDEKNLVTLLYSKGRLEAVQLRDGKETSISSSASHQKKKNISLRMVVHNGHEYYFFYSLDGKNFTALNQNALDGSFLPPWDRAVRAGIAGRRGKSKSAVFESFEINYEN